MSESRRFPVEKVNPVKPSGSAFLLFSLVLSLILIIIVLMPIEPSDYWTYLRIGDEILTTRQIPQTEFMTYTRAGEPALYSYWLSSLAMLALYRLGGVSLTLLSAAICVGALYLFLWLCLRELKLGPISASLLLFFAAMMGSNNWSVRPQMFAYPLFGLLLWLLLRWHRGNERFLWLMVPAVLFWTNLHGSFVLAFLLIVSALIFGEGNRRKLLLVLGASLAATLLNPYGLRIWLNMGSMIGNELIKTYSSEWFPPVNQGWQLNLFFASLLLAPVFTAFTPARVKKLGWVWFLGFGWMALSSVRYVIWFSVIEALLLAQLAFPWLERFLDRRPVFINRGFNLSLACLALAASLAFLPGIRERWWQQSPEVLTDSTPVEAAQWLSQHPELPGELWSNWAASIYLTWALPDRKVWITNRIEDFPEQQLLENKSLARARFDWQEILDSYQVRLLLLSRQYDAPLMKQVEESPVWQVVYQDEQSVIFSR